jgi:hypothetical protein
VRRLTFREAARLVADLAEALLDLLPDWVYRFPYGWPKSATA